MPETDVIIFAAEDGSAPFLQWLDGLPEKVRYKCIDRVERLAAHGHELRRPLADFLRDGIYELRAPYQRRHYRILYFFQGQQAVISHGLHKESRVPDKDIERAVQRKKQFKENPAKHTYGMEQDG